MSEIEWMEIFSGNLRSILEEYGMTQKELAEAMGVSEASISWYIRGSRIPTVKTIINMAYALDINVSELIDFGEPIN